MRSLGLSIGAVALVCLLGCSAWLGGASSSSPDSARSSSGAFPQPFQIIAHRGASAYAPENTLPAFRAARDLGAVEVELDVQLSADDRVVLFHDANLEKKTGRSGTVRDYTLQELRGFDIGLWFDAAHPEAASGSDSDSNSKARPRFAGTTLDSLESLFDEMGRDLFYHVELKDGEPELPARVLAVIDRFQLRDRVIVTSFRFEQLERTRQLAPDLPICLLILKQPKRDGSLEDWIDRAASAGFSEVGVAAQEITRDLVLHARAQGLWIRAWSIKSLEDMEHAVAVGSNGMTIDWPDQLIRRFLEAGGSPGAAKR